MDALYSVVCRLGMESSGFTSGATLAMALLQKLEQQAAATGTSTAGLGKSLGMVAGGLALIAGGAAGVGVMKSWATAAGDLQSAMAGVGLSTQGTVAQLKALHDQTFTVANKTQFAATDVAAIDKLAATNGLNQRDVLLRVVPTLGNLAEIDNRLRGISYTQSVPAAITVAHDFQSYPKNAAQAAGFTKLLDLFGRSQLVAGTTPDAMARLITYLAPARAAYNLSPEDIISTAALASNVGLAGGRGGGSRIMAMFRQIAPLLSSRGALHNAALDKIEQLGGGTFFKGGNFEAAGGVANMLTIVERAMGHIQDQSKRMALLTAAFGAAGSTAISVMATPGAVQRFQSIQNLLGANGIASTSQMQQTLNTTYQGQMQTLSGNLTSIKALLGEQLLPIITPVIHGFVELTSGIVTMLKTHPALAQFITTFALVSTAAALVAGPILVAAGAFGILSAAGVVGTIAFAPFIAIALGIIAAVSGVVLLITHWSQVMGFLGSMVDGVGAQIGAFLGLAGDLLGVFGQLAGAVGQALGLDVLGSQISKITSRFEDWISGTLHLRDAFKWAGSELQGLLRWLGILHDGPKVATTTVTVPANATTTATTFTTPKKDIHGHTIAGVPGRVHQAVRPTATDSGTVGLPTALRIAPLKNAPPAHHTTVNLHVAAGASTIHVHPGPTHDPKKIADEAAKKAGDRLGHHIAAKLASAGVLPSTTRPTLHQLAVS